MALTWYADVPGRRRRQVLADAALLLWCVAAIWVAVLVHQGVADAQGGARKLETGTNDLADHLSAAGEGLGKIPLVGGGVSEPFTQAADTSRDLSASGHDLAHGLGLFGWAAAILTALVPILFALLPWCLLRLRYARRAGRMAQLRALEGGQRLLALEALTTAPPHLLAQVGADPAQLWQDGDAEATRSLASLALFTCGLRPTR